MALICKDDKGQTEVLLNPFDREKIFTGQKTTLYFHKKVNGIIENQNLGNITSVLKAAIKEISDLIY